MDCLEFRRAALADPRRLPAAAAAHMHGCSTCRRFLDRSLEDETLLADALRIAVPQGCEKRLLGRFAQRRFIPRVAIAAGVLVVSAIAVFVATPRPDPAALAGIDFVVFEEAQSIVESKPVKLDVAAAAALRMGLALSAQLGEIRYICLYPFAGGAAHHLLVKTPLGKVTLLLMPERERATRAAASARGLEAAVLPAAVGTVAIVADSPHSIRRTERLLTR